MKKWLVTLLVCFVPVLPAQPDREVKVVELKYMDATRIRNSGVLDAFQVQISGSGQTLVLGGPASNVTAAEAFIRKFDVRPRNVEAVFYVIAAGAKSADVSAMPNELEPVVKQLRSAFAYQSFRLLETAIARGRENGQLRTSGHLPVNDPDSSMKRTYNLSADRISIATGEKANIVRFDKLEFYVNSPDVVRTNVTKKPEYTISGVTADLDVREGQKVVVGKSNFDGADGTFFLIVTAKVVD
jgi:hypothetical protein